MMHIRHDEICKSYKRQIQAIKAGSANKRGTITAEMYTASKAMTMRLVGHEPASKWTRISNSVVKRVIN